MDYKKEYEKWLGYDFLDKDIKKELKAMGKNEELIKDSFSYFVPFGTAGMRGTMGVGTNRLNKWTVRRATYGVIEYIKKHKKEKEGIVITYDTRNNSKFFAEVVASFTSKCGIKTYLTKDVRPTPFLSYLVRNLHTFVGINITASHNKKEDNGYKVYLSDGAQFSAPADKEIIDFVNKITDIKTIYDLSGDEIKFDKKYFSYVPDKLDKDFARDAKSMIINKDFVKRNGSALKIVYTPLHGTGNIFIKDCLNDIGFKNVFVVKSQDDKNGDFKTLIYPNPESKDAFKESLKIANSKDADLIVATDPDADRLGVYVRVKKGEYLPLTGNELASIILEYILYFRKKEGYNYQGYFVAKSFVTSNLIDRICNRYNIEEKITPTGFKWIGREILNSDKKFIFGAEESYGFLISDYVRDKDSVTATLITCEIALALKEVGMTLIDLLNTILNAYGVCKSFVDSFEYKGVDGKEKMTNIMANLRSNKIYRFADIRVKEIIDYKENICYDMIGESKSHYDFPTNDTLKYILEDENTITIRPSGTEPKIKIYFDIVDKTEELAKNKYEILKQQIKKYL